MLVLSLDTTTRSGGCALMRDGRVVREQASDPSRDQAERLPGEVAALLERESVPLQEIDCFAVATGPGSFTGLRVGIATMQGLAMATGKPLIGVSAFDALAMLADAMEDGASGVMPRRTDPPGGSLHVRGTAHVAVWIDAWRGEVFAAMYGDGHLLETPVVARPEDLLARLKGQSRIFIGDGTARYQKLIRAALGHAARLTSPAAPLLASAIATLASEALRAGRCPPPHAIRPIYVSRIGAERAMDPGRA